MPVPARQLCPVTGSYRMVIALGNLAPVADGLQGVGLATTHFYSIGTLRRLPRLARAPIRCGLAPCRMQFGQQRARGIEHAARAEIAHPVRRRDAMQAEPPRRGSPRADPPAPAARAATTH